MTAHELGFRTATLDDVEALVALVESAYRGDVSRQGWTTEADILDGQRIDREGIVALVDNSQARLLIVERNGQRVACCELQRQGDHAYFGMFSVSPTEQGSGIGKLVLAEAERFVREVWNCREMQMTVIDVRSELIAWYERRGYQRTGIHKPFPYGDDRFGKPKRDDLRFEVLTKSLV
jgi:ribosomal protein S18 acetylase RimI-like enzyme